MINEKTLHRIAKVIDGNMWENEYYTLKIRKGHKGIGIRLYNDLTGQENEVIFLNHMLNRKKETR